MCSRFEFATKNKESSESFLFLWCLFDLQDLSFWDVKRTEDEKVWCFQWLQQSQSPFSIWIASPSSQISLYITFSGYVTPSFLFTCHIIRFTHRVQFLTNSFWPLYQEASSFYFAAIWSNCAQSLKPFLWWLSLTKAKRITHNSEYFQTEQILSGCVLLPKEATFKQIDWVSFYAKMTLKLCKKLHHSRKGFIICELPLQTKEDML